MSTNFFEQQDQAKSNTHKIVFFLLLGLLAMITTTYVLVTLVWSGVMTKLHAHEHSTGLIIQWWNPQLLAIVAGAITVIVACASFFRTVQLKVGGGASVAESMGGREITQDTYDADERKLLNVVEEMSIASSVPMPRVFVMEDEDSDINAFAAGWSKEQAVIGVTRGAITRLSRDELQGVIGHEFSHILNGDMHMNIRLMGLIFGLLAMVVMGRLVLDLAWASGSRSSRDDEKDKGNLGYALIAVGIIFIVMGYLSALFAHLMQAAISRQREYLADASSVQFTRNPKGLAGALQKISEVGCEVRNVRARESSHMFFGEADRPFMGLFATHPPLEERIKRILGEAI